jgi:hypothetical protein
MPFRRLLGGVRFSGSDQASHTSRYAAAGRKGCPSSLINFLRLRVNSRAASTVMKFGAEIALEIERRPPNTNCKGHQVTKRLGTLIAVIAAVVAGGLALGLGLMSNSHATAIKPTPTAQTTPSTTPPPPPTTPPTAVPAPPPPTTPATTPPDTVPPPPPTTAPPVATPPAVVNGIAQGNGGDMDPDNNGGPSDGDGNL